MILSIVYIKFLVLFLTNRVIVKAACPNLCNKNGLCTEDNKCACFDGYMGSDCSLSKR